MKRLIYLIVAALVSTVVVAPSAAAQGENVQQLQQTLQDAQARVAAAQEQMQSPEGQAALAEA
jgi:outer membrane lipoprotein-sorting protein